MLTVLLLRVRRSLLHIPLMSLAVSRLRRMSPMIAFMVRIQLDSLRHVVGLMAARCSSIHRSK